MKCVVKGGGERGCVGGGVVGCANVGARARIRRCPDTASSTRRAANKQQGRIGRRRRAGNAGVGERFCPDEQKHEPRETKTRKKTLTEGRSTHTTHTTHAHISPLRSLTLGRCSRHHKRTRTQYHIFSGCCFFVFLFFVVFPFLLLYILQQTLQQSSSGLRKAHGTIDDPRRCNDAPLTRGTSARGGRGGVLRYAGPRRS